GQAGQAGGAAVAAHAGPTAAVVLDADPQLVGRTGDVDPGPAGTGVPGDVRQRLGDHEVGDRLPLPVQRPVQMDLQLDRDGGAGRQGRERRVQATVGEHGRVDPAGELTQVGDHCL